MSQPSGSRPPGDPLRYRAWTRRPARSVRYRLGDRIADAYTGHRDGRSGLPTFGGDAGGGAVVTPRLEEIRRLIRERIDQELLQSERDQAALGDRLEAVRSKAGRVEDPADGLWQRLQDASKPLTDAELGRRRMWEGNWPDSLVRARRGAAHERLRVQANAEHASVRAALADAAHAEAALVRAIADRHRAARIRAHRLSEHGHRRQAVYWQYLVRVHPAGPELAGLIGAVGPELPAWAGEAADDAGAATAPGGDRAGRGR